MLKRFFVGFILLLVAAGSLVTWQLPRVVSFIVVPVVTSELARVGVYEFAVSVERIGLQQAYLRSLSFRYDNATDVIGVADGISISWTGLEILAGRVSALNIDSLNLEIRSDEQVEEQEITEKVGFGAFAAAVEFISRPLAEKLPFKDLLVTDLRVYQTVPQSDKKQLLDGNLAIHKVPSEDAMVAAYSSEKIKIEVNSAQSGALVANAKAADGEQLATLNINHSNQKLLIGGLVNQAVFEHFEAKLPEGFEDYKVSPLQFEGSVDIAVLNTSEPQKYAGEFVLSVDDIGTPEFELSGISSRFSFEELDTDTMQITVDGDTTVDAVETSDLRLQGLAITHDFDFRSGGGVNYSLAFELDELSTSSGVSARSASANLAGELNIVGQQGIVISQLNMAVEQPSMSISAEDSIYASAVSVSLADSVEGQEIRFQDGWLHSDNKISIDIPGLVLHENLLPLDLAVNIEELAYPLLEQGDRFISGGTYIRQLVVQGQNIPLTFGDIDQEFSLSGDSLHVSGNFEDKVRKIGISSDTNINFASGEFGSGLQVEELVVESANRLAGIFTAYDLPLAVVTGQVESSFAIEWNIRQPLSKLSVIGDIRLTDIGGAYEEYFFSGFSSEYRGTVYPRLNSIGESILTIDQIDVGLAIKDFKGVMSFSQGPESGGIELQIFSALGRTMGGYIAIRPVVINSANTRKELSMLIIGLDIETLLREQAVKDVVASGKLSGEVPIIISEDGLSVRGGRVYAAEPGGNIQYKGDIRALSVAAGPAGFVFQALQDFTYGSMNIFPEYSPDGTLTMRLEVRGNNPQVEQGRPINFNINLEQNLIKLRESLRYVDGLNDEIDEKVQAFYRNNAS